MPCHIRSSSMAPNSAPRLRPCACARAASRSLTSASTRIVVIAMEEVYVVDVYVSDLARSEGWRIAVVIITVCRQSETFDGCTGLSNEFVKWHLFAHMTMRKPVSTGMPAMISLAWRSQSADRLYL